MVKITGCKEFTAISDSDAENNSIFLDSSDDEIKIKDNSGNNRVFPSISSGTAAPVTTPTKVGDIYIDTNNSKLYFAIGSSSSADWVAAN